MVPDEASIVIQRRGPHEHGEIFDYSREKVWQLLERFFDEVNK
jgi:hypothetical protein